MSDLVPSIGLGPFLGVNGSHQSLSTKVKNVAAFLIVLSLWIVLSPWRDVVWRQLCVDIGRG